MFKLAVPIKQVVKLDDEIELDPDETDVDLEFAERDLNDWDSFALEAAVAIRESSEDAEVIALTVGGEEAEEALVDCLARGADRAIRISPDGVSLLDPLQVATVLAAALADEEPDLTLCGVQSSDSASGATGIALAGYLDLPHVAVVRRLDLDAERRSVRLERELEGGLIEELSIPLPCLLTVQTGANEPRYATLRAIKQAAEKPLVRMGLTDLGLEPDALAGAGGARIARMFTPSVDSTARMLEGDPDAVAEAILDILRDDAGIGVGASR